MVIGKSRKKVFLIPIQSGSKSGFGEQFKSRFRGHDYALLYEGSYAGQDVDIHVAMEGIVLNNTGGVYGRSAGGLEPLFSYGFMVPLMGLPNLLKYYIAESNRIDFLEIRSNIEYHLVTLLNKTDEYHKKLSSFTFNKRATYTIVGEMASLSILRSSGQALLSLMYDRDTYKSLLAYTALSIKHGKSLPDPRLMHSPLIDFTPILRTIDYVRKVERGYMYVYRPIIFAGVIEHVVNNIDREGVIAAVNPAYIKLIEHLLSNHNIPSSLVEIER